MKFNLLFSPIIITLFLSTLLLQSCNSFFIDDGHYTYDIPVEYHSIFKESAVSNMKVSETYHTKNRRPICYIDYDSSYHIVVYTIELKNDIDIKKISVLYGNPQMTPAIVYHGPSWKSIEYHVSKNKIQINNNQVYLTLGGDSLKTIRSGDNTLSCNLLFTSMGISNSPKGDIDVFADIRNNTLSTRALPMNLMLKIIKNSLYIIMLYNDDQYKYLPENLLSGLLK